MASTLHHAYQTLMTKAPGAAFRRARTLYLNKYAFPDPNPDSAFRLFVSREALEEGLRPADDGNPEHSIVTLTATALELAVVHWQQPRHQQPPCWTTSKDTWSKRNQTPRHGINPANPGSAMEGIRPGWRPPKVC